MALEKLKINLRSKIYWPDHRSNVINWTSKRVINHRTNFIYFLICSGAPHCCSVALPCAKAARYKQCTDTVTSGDIAASITATTWACLKGDKIIILARKKDPERKAPCASQSGTEVAMAAFLSCPPVCLPIQLGGHLSTINFMLRLHGALHRHQLDHKHTFQTECTEYERKWEQLNMQDARHSMFLHEASNKPHKRIMLSEKLHGTHQYISITTI